jgi:hypothetical protein
MPMAIYSAPSVHPLAPLLEALSGIRMSGRRACPATRLSPLKHKAICIHRCDMQALLEHAATAETLLPEELVIRLSALIDQMPRSKEGNSRSDIENALRLLKDDGLSLLKNPNYLHDRSGSGRQIERHKECPQTRYCH